VAVVVRVPVGDDHREDHDDVREHGRVHGAHAAARL
jgi:hypothetical protein